MINFCIDYAVENKITSYARLRKGIYEEWKRRWDYSSHFCHSACKIALAMLKSHRRKKRGKPVARKLFMQLDPSTDSTEIGSGFLSDRGSSCSSP